MNLKPTISRVDPSIGGEISEQEKRYDWLFFMTDSNAERVVISYWPKRLLNENFAVFQGIGTLLSRQYDLEVVGDVSSDGGIYANVLWKGGSQIISVKAGEYLTKHVWVDGRLMLRFESWNCGFFLTPNEKIMVIEVSGPPKPRRD